MDIKLNEEQMQSIVSAAIFQTLDEQQKEMMIKDALKHLMTAVPRGSYGERYSPLAEAFHRAVQDQARKLATEMLENNAEINTKIQSLISEGVQQLMTDKREGTVLRIADAIVKGMTGERY